MYVVRTSSGVCGARMAPRRPHVEQAASRRWRARVGNSSAVYTYSAFSAMVAPALPARNRTVPAALSSGNNTKLA